MEKYKKMIGGGRLAALLICILFPMNVFAQRIDIQGVITDSYGEPVIGAAVLVKGTVLGTATDIDGNYAINGVAPDATLEISSIGYKTTEVAVNGRTTINVTVEDDKALLDEVVVIGYGTMDKKELTSAITHISNKDFLPSSAQSPAMMIQGKAAGVSITNTGTGDPNNGASIQVRGVSSRAAGLGPLIVVDGVPGADMSNLNPNDIESFDILKDGAASSIYGTRGSNGVILITTKKGSKDGTIHTQYNGTFSFDVMKRELDMLDADEYRELRIKGDGKTVDYGDNVDWLGEVSRLGTKHTHALTLSGGNAKTNYRVTADYRDAKGIDIRSTRQEYGARAAISHTTNDGLFTFTANIAPRIIYRDNADWGVFRRAIEANPTTPVMDPDDPSKFTNFKGNQTEEVNPVELLTLEQSTGEDRLLEWDATAKANLLPLLFKDGTGNHDLTTQVSFADHQATHFNGWFRPSTSTLAQNAGRAGQASRSYSQYRFYNFEWLTNYMTHINDHNIKAMFGYSYQYEQSAGLSAENSDFPNDGLTFDNLGTGEYAMEENIVGFGSYRNDAKLIAFFGRVSYDWKGRYLLTASLRYEGSSRFGANNKWGYFPAVSAGWRISDEDFMQDVTWVNELKIRGDYGVTGNQNFDSYRSLSTMQAFGSYSYNGKDFKVWGPSKNVNPELRWEKGKNWNVGIDFALFGHKVFGSFNYFNRRQVDLLGDYNVSVPPYLHTTTFVNVGTMRNSGFEFDIHWNVVDNKNFSYNIGVIGSTMSNEFESFSSSEYVGQKYYDQAGTEAPFPYYNLQRIEEGRRIGSFYMWEYAGHDKEGNWIIYDKDGDMIKAAQGTEQDRKYVGNGLPKFTGSMTHNFRYKNFDLSIFFRGAFGYHIFNIHDFYYGTRNFTHNVLKKAYEKNAPIALGANPVVCDYFLERGDFLKLDMVNLGYTLKTDWKYLKKFRVYVTGKNLATLTQFSGVDPDSYQLNGLAPGATGSRQYYPSSRQFILGLQIDF